MIRKMSSSAVLGGVDEQPQDTVTNGSTTSLNRRRWSSFKSRFKPPLSSSGSIFYLDKDQAETPDCIPNVYSDKPTPTTPPSVTMATGSPTTTSVTMATNNNRSTTSPSVTMTTDPRRYSIASSSLRPTSPPPPPPPHSSSLHRQSLCEEVLAKRGGLRSVARGGRREDVGGVERVGGSERGGGAFERAGSGGGSDRGGGEGFQRVGSGGGSDRGGGGGGERIEGKVGDRLGSIERKTGVHQQDRLGVSERGIGERLSGGGGGEALDRLGGGVFQRVGSGGSSDRRRRSGGGGSERGEYGNGSLVSESDENTSSWDRRMSGVDRMSDRSSSHGSDLHLRFADEPLYQFYNETVTKEELNKCYSRDDSSRGSVADFDSDGYEEIGSDRLLISRPSAMDLIAPKQGHHRTLWCEIPEVINSEILKTLSKDERRIQEAKFEVMTSEASYLKSLTVLEKHFANSAAFKDESVLPTEDRKSLFGHLTGVR
ncbi:translation initiation factor IF-2-like, partial [Nilaparvata lugens]|uniref:translation initiation factor IF-2-like n=1 Tax=Nilaparvata lugens TaxID=108931 RepID=UPI00193DA294